MQNIKTCSSLYIIKGTTKFMHFHGLHNNKGMLVDTPGYGTCWNNIGFANMNKKRRNMWFGSTL